jgi:hypothetical protein
MNKEDIIRIHSCVFSNQTVKTYSAGGSGSTHLIHLHGGWRFLKKDEPVIDKSITKCELKREWVGLTDEETNALIQKWAGELVFEVTQALKEKNNG